jgi:hypothetical protein
MAERRGTGLQILLHGFKSRSDLHYLYPIFYEILGVRRQKRKIYGIKIGA